MYKHAVIVIPFITAVIMSSSGFAAGPEQQVDAYVARQMKDRGIPGMAVAVVRHGEPVILKAYGVSSVTQNVPVTKDTVFQLFSVSKMWAGVAAMRLAQQGKLTMETPIGELIPGLPESWADIRVKHLLSHTSGIAEWRSNPRGAEIPEEEKADLPARRAVELSAQMPRISAAGERFSYHRTAYSLFTLVVETVSGMRYAEFLDREVFSPLGMSASRFGDTFAVIPNRPSTNYARNNGVLRNWTYEFGSSGYSAAALNSSIMDVVKFLVAMDKGNLLKPESLGALWTPFRLNNGTVTDYGLGWTVGTHAGRKVVGHEGGGAVWIAHFPMERLSIAVLTNLNGSGADEMQYGIADIFLR